MESLNLNMLANSLPNSNLANAEKDLMNNFKAAALSLTTLYRSSRVTSKRAYNAGYASACQDLLLMIQQGVSAGESSSDPNGTGGMTIGRVMDYIEARLEAIKSREDEEEEDDERERKEKDKSNVGGPSTAAPATTSTRGGAGPSVPVKAPSTMTRPKDSTPLTPHTPPSFSQPHNTMPHSFVPSSPTPSTSSLASPLHIPTASSMFPHRSVKTAKLPSAAAIPSATTPFVFNGHNTSFPVTSLSLNSAPVAEGINAGTKRRHTAMLIDSTVPATSAIDPSSTTGGNGAARRRTRSARGAVASSAAALGGLDQNVTSRGGEAMDVEEEGRERKRVARR
ncbi:hypothetical protein BXZ70DRAFT_1008871 [Cristinia sonorae]|uniref:Uncharacterized protein n=1 Tax=Cristinia sonorae TaxID=1940300 RepID=A0A8K0XP56_9AGAR|nr:hypothetical protein BXZ70DRAFT_1008871 [Cristinia sonorae]